MIDTVIAIGFLSFNVRIISNHRRIFLDIKQQWMLQGEIHSIQPKEQKIMKTKFKKTATNYIEGVSKFFENDQMLHRIKNIEKNKTVINRGRTNSEEEKKKRIKEKGKDIIINNYIAHQISGWSE